MRYYAVIVFTSFFLPSLLFAGMDINTCIFQKTVNLDDGVTSAEIIGKSVIHECKDVIDASIEEYGKPIDKDMLISELNKNATAFVLKNRKDNKSKGVEEEYFIGAWHYTVRSKNGQPKQYQLMQVGRDNTYAFTIKCDSSGPTLQFFISEYEVKNDSEYEAKEMGPGIIILPLKIYFDGNSTKPFDFKWFKNNSNHLAQTIGDTVYLLVKEMQKFKTMSIVANPYKEPVTLDLNGFQAAILKLANHCKSFNDSI